MKGLAHEIADSLPAGLGLPSEFEAAMDWMEEVGAVGRMRDGKRYGMTNPEDINREGKGLVYFHAVYPWTVQAWTGSKATGLNRLAPIIRTGGDGSMAALWRDDNGITRVVHMGSGSGSVAVGTFTRCPLDFLRLLAVGYEEICWPDDYDLEPIEACFDRTTYQPPTEFRTWLTSTYGVTIPRTAAPLVRPMAEIGAPSDDPFCRWLNELS